MTVALAEPASVITVATRFKGTLDVPREQVLRFLQPVLGFERHPRWITYQIDPGPFHFLQAIDDPNASFCVMAPFKAGLDLDWEIGRDDATDLGVTDADELELYTMVVLDPDPKQIRTNLRAPILVCRRTGLAKQLVIDNPKLPIRFFLKDMPQKK